MSVSFYIPHVFERALSCFLLISYSLWRQAALLLWYSHEGSYPQRAHGLFSAVDVNIKKNTVKTIYNKVELGFRNVGF